MFTGIVEELGRFAGRQGSRYRFEAATVTAGAELGASIAVNGVCLTMVAAAAGWWEADVVEETLLRSTLGSLAPGDAVNLERPLRPVDRLGGHIVQGHVDAVGQVIQPAPDLRVAVNGGGLRYVAPKGSIAVDGVSLTVADLGDAWFGVSVIPHTAAVTTLGRRRPGDPVNLEFDVIAKYVESLLGQWGP